VKRVIAASLPLAKTLVAATASAEPVYRHSTHWNRAPRRFEPDVNQHRGQV